MSKGLPSGLARLTAIHNRTATIVQTAMEIARVNQVSGKIACALDPALSK
jgi:hypothetical protein